MCMMMPPMNPLAMVSPLAAILPKNPVTSFAEKTINRIATPVTKPVEKATGMKVNAAAAVAPAAFGVTGLQIPQG